MLDFEKEFSDFVASGNNNSAISEIYKILPTLDNEQIKAILLMRYYCKKYQLDNINKLIDDAIEMNRSNKNLNFVKSLNVKSLLKAYTLDEYMRGIKVQSQIQESK